MTSTTDSIRVSVVVQTHWDREWYLPHQSFIARLLGVMEKVAVQLESGQLHSFLFDGQTAAMEDLLDNCEPALGSRVRRLVRERRIVLGPWYVMADQFLCAGEALLRNLEIGLADATALGNCQLVGYLPDTFGHVSQMPQILAEFGIEHAVMWRGVDVEHSEFDWIGPDGSVAGAVFLTQGYYQHPFNVDGWQQAVTGYLDQVAPRSLGAPLLLTQGGDHLLSSDALAERVTQYNGAQSRYHLEQATLSDYVAAAMQASAGRRAGVHGELRQNVQAFVLPDVLSTRRYLKRLNQAAEDRLLGLIEPLYAQLRLSGDISDAYPAAYLEKTWRLLLQQQAHDSICGCSVDAVHDEMRTRYVLLDQRLGALVDRAAASAGMVALSLQEAHADGPFADDSRFTLFNPLPKLDDGWREYDLFLKGEAAPALRLVGPDGAPLEHVLLGAAPHATLRSPLDDFPDQVRGHLYQVAIRCSLPGMGALACTAETAPAGPAAAPVAALTGAAIENDFMALRLEDGVLAWLDKASGETVNGALSIHTELDAGDSYNFSPPPRQHGTVQDRFDVVGVRRVTGMQELTLAIGMSVPASLDAGRSGPADARVRNSGLLRIRLWQGRALAECRFDWDNAARDQRTRLLLSMPQPQPVRVTGSDSAFSWELRPVVKASYPAQPSRREMAVAVNPSYSAILAGKLGFCHRAMQEYEVLEIDGRQYLGVTMVRSVGWLSRRDLVTRGVGAGPDIATPGAQCIGSERFEFAFGRCDHHVQVLNHAQALRRPPVLLRGHSARWRAPFELGDDVLQVSALRMLNGEQELRVWNPTSAPLALPMLGDGWSRVRADGAATDQAPVLAPFGIATLRRAA